MQTPAASRRAQYELWIFSYAIRRESSRKRLSRLMSEQADHSDLF
jgi:hypothetical protein